MLHLAENLWLLVALVRMVRLGGRLSHQPLPERGHETFRHSVISTCKPGPFPGFKTSERQSALQPLLSL